MAPDGRFERTLKRQSLSRRKAAGRKAADQVRVDCDQGIDTTCANVSALPARCRFGGCQHENEPRCAVKDTIRTGVLDARRLKSFSKLVPEKRLNSEPLDDKTRPGQGPRQADRGLADGEKQAQA
jgi:ribosome biogenesis GTPase